MTRISLDKSAWKREKDGKGNISYLHIPSGQWIIRKTVMPYSNKLAFRGFYHGPERAETPTLRPCRTLAEAKLTVQAYCEIRAIGDDPKNRFIRALKDGNMELAADIVFGHISDEIEKAEELLERRFDDRLDDLRISR